MAPRRRLFRRCSVRDNSGGLIECIKGVGQERVDGQHVVLVESDGLWDQRELTFDGTIQFAEGLGHLVKQTEDDRDRFADRCWGFDGIFNSFLCLAVRSSRLLPYNVNGS